MVAAAFFTTGAGQAVAPSSESPAAAVSDRPGVLYSERTSTTGTVQSIDHGNRTVTLKRSDGPTITLKAPPAAKNFDQIEPGDSVRADYLESIAIFVRRTGAAPEATQAQKVSVAPKGQKPEAVLVDTVEITARVEAIDYSSRIVTLRGPQGARRDVKVDERVERLNEVTVGDEVVIRHTEAVAITFSK
jgi:hypothetical protein